VLIISLPFMISWGYGLWFLWQGFRDNPMLRTAIEMTQKDGLAQRVLGTPITVRGVAGNEFSFVAGQGARNNYVLRLEGPRGEGTLAVKSHAERGQPKIDEMTLTGPGGEQYDLLHHAPVPSAGNGAQPI
jgi:hypothetical protein